MSEVPGTQERLNIEAGRVFRTSIKCRICLGCGYQISDTGLCHGDCQYDADSPRLPGTYIIRIWERVDTLVLIQESAHVG